VRFQAEAFSKELIREKTKEIVSTLGIDEKDACYFIFTGEASNTTYDPRDERINILFKDGKVRDISEVDNALIQHNLRGAMRKHYICYKN
jgi:hypothetical protein